MLDLKAVRQDPDAIADRLAVKHFEFDVERFKSLDAARKQADSESQSLLAERKQASKKVGELIKGGMAVEDAKAEVASSLEKIDQQLESLKDAAKTAQDELHSFLANVPNIPAPDVPMGKDEADNLEVLLWGEPKAFDFEVKDHVDLGLPNSQLDFDSAAAITGSRFAVMRGELARMHRALVQLMLNTHIEEHGYQEVWVPYIVNQASLFGTSQLPKFEADLFKLEGDSDYYLIPTAEVPITNLVRERILEPDELGDGLKFTAHTPCFRSEAGSYGRDTRGMIRQHQFEKVEMVQLVRPEQGSQALEELTGHAEKILQLLNLPYRKVLLCGGDLGFGSYKTYDLEVWLPAQNTYREISSCSLFNDFQARRMNARWRNPDTGKPEFLHSINGSGLAVGRTLVAIMENYQDAQGNIEVPQALAPWMGGCTRIDAS